MKLSGWSMAYITLLFSLGHLPAFGQTKVAKCDPRLGLAETKPMGYTKGRWQDAQDAEGGADPDVAREVRNVLRFGASAVPLLIGCLSDESRTRNRIWDYWPEPKVRDLAFSILCDLFSDPKGNQTLDDVITWSDVQDESPDQPAWIAWGIYNEKHGQQYVQQVWLKVWAENKRRTYWDAAGKCFRVKQTV